MRTKIVYVLTSSSKDFYLEQVILSIYSLRFHNSNVKITIVTDEDSKKSLVGNRHNIYDMIDEIIVLKIPSEFNNLQKSRYLKTKLREVVIGDYLYIDTDTIITESLEDVDYFKCDLGAVLDKHVKINKNPLKNHIYKCAKIFNWTIPEDDKYFNGGMMYAKDSEVAHNFYDTWHNVWKDGVINKGISIDQPALARANELNGYPIEELSGIYNCQVIENGLKFLFDAKVIHYYASNIGKWDCPYLFRDDKLYQEVRKNGIDSQVRDLILNAKSAFSDKCLILGGNRCDAYHTFLSGIARQCYSKFPSFNKVLDKFFAKIYH